MKDAIMQPLVLQLDGRFLWVLDEDTNKFSSEKVYTINGTDLYINNGGELISVSEADILTRSEIVERNLENLHTYRDSINSDLADVMETKDNLVETLEDLSKKEVDLQNLSDEIRKSECQHGQP